MAMIESVANYLLEKSGYTMTNLKLQKLLYFVYGIHLAIFDRRPFDDDYPQAWQYGPVFPEMYHELKSYGADPIRHPLQAPLLDDIDVIEVADVVIRKLGDLSESKLIKITHSDDSPWANVYESGKRNQRIPDEQIKRYFSQHVSRT